MLRLRDKWSSSATISSRSGAKNNTDMHLLTNLNSGQVWCSQRKIYLIRWKHRGLLLKSSALRPTTWHLWPEKTQNLSKTKQRQAWLQAWPQAWPREHRLPTVKKQSIASTVGTRRVKTLETLSKSWKYLSVVAGTSTRRQAWMSANCKSTRQAQSWFGSMCQLRFRLTM